jgi:methionine-rich copper-binding protein CopC
MPAKIERARLRRWATHVPGRYVALAILAAASGLVPFGAYASPRQVRGSTPAAEAIIHGRHAEYVVQFDGPVDHRTAHLDITRSGKLVQSLRPLLDSAADVLFAASTAPAPGKYLLHWKVRSSDGESSSGDIPFSVAP